MIVKLCGQTRLQDIEYSFKKSADLCGVVIEVPSSKRTVSVADARHLFAPFKEKMVALTADADRELYRQIAEVLSPFAMQLTANEPEEDVNYIKESLGIEVFKSLHLPLEGSVPEEGREDYFTSKMESYLSAGAYGFVLDSSVPNMYGGSGKKSDWNLAKGIIDAMPKARILLAGGIGPENGAEAAALAPWGIDLASGVEDAPGQKSEEKIDLLMERLGR